MAIKLNEKEKAIILKRMYEETGVEWKFADGALGLYCTFSSEQERSAMQGKMQEKSYFELVSRPESSSKTLSILVDNFPSLLKQLAHNEYDKYLKRGEKYKQENEIIASKLNEITPPLINGLLRMKVFNLSQCQMRMMLHA
ncbi:MAG: hypothetical protein ACRCXC_09435 [Legionella sp.]